MVLEDVTLADMECSLCTEIYDSEAVTPCILGCGHTFCFTCVKKAISYGRAHPTWVAGKNSRLACPGCRDPEALIYNAPNHALRAVSGYVAALRRAKVILLEEEAKHVKTRSEDIMRKNIWMGRQEEEEQRLLDKELSLNIREAELRLAELRLQQKDQSLQRELAGRT